MKVERKNVLIEGFEEPCIIVHGRGKNKVRISNCYKLVGSNCLLVTEILGNMVNSMNECRGDFLEVSDDEAIRIAKNFSAYL